MTGDIGPSGKGFSRAAFFAVTASLLIFLISLFLYLSTLAPGMLRGDSGEFQWAMASLNVAHATGYPLFTLVGYGWLQLPLAGPAAWRLNLLAPIFGAGAVTMVFVLAHSITRRLDAAIVASIFFALAPVFWFNASVLEVYTLNALFLGLILYLLWRWSCKPTSTGSLYLAFFFLGLALAHHRLIVLTLPGILIFLLLTEHRFFFNWRRLIVLALLVLPGLSLYTYVPLRLLAAGETLHYALFDIILGQEFSGSLFREFNFLQVVWQIPVQNFHVGLILAAAGAVTLFIRKRNLAVLLLLVYVADVAFGLAYWVPDVEVFLTPSFVVTAVWIAAGAAWLIEWLGMRVRPTLSRHAALASAVLLTGLPLVGLAQYPNIRSRVSGEAGIAETRARAILASNLPSGALLELDWETATAVRFLQTTEGTRRDLEARLIKMNERDEYLWALKNVDAGRPVFVERGVTWTRTYAGYRVQSAPVELEEILPEGVEALAVDEKLDDRVRLLAMRSDTESLTLYWQVARPLDRDLATFIHFFDADGQPLGQQDHAPCCEALFGYRTSEWEVGREYADTFRPAPAGTTYLQLGMYALDSGDIDPFGRTLFLQLKPVELSPSARHLGIRLGDAIIARAYEISREGGNLKLALFWETGAALGKDYTMFVHLLDSSGKILKQVDREPLAGVFPTGAWRPGQLVRDTYTLPATNGAVKLEFGLYDASNGQRLMRADGSGDVIAIDLR
jgi:hypothetical protein